jgi:AraC-like DNA-binding protein
MNQVSLLGLKSTVHSESTNRLSILHFIESEKQFFPEDNSCFKWLFIEEGEGSIQIEKSIINTQSGDLILIPSEERYNLSKLATTKYWIVIYRDEAKEKNFDNQSHDFLVLLPDKFRIMSLIKSQNIQTRHFNLNSLERLRWLNRLQQMKSELQEQSFGFVEMLNTLLTQLFMDTLRLMTPNNSPNPVESHPLLIDVFRAIEQNYQQYRFSLSDVAKTVRLSPAYLTDLVRRKTGKTVVGWIVEYRMSAARRLLETTTQPITQIAIEIGYEDTGYFIRQFRRLHGITPKAWRDRHKIIF